MHIDDYLGSNHAIIKLKTQKHLSNHTVTKLGTQKLLSNHAVIKLGTQKNLSNELPLQGRPSSCYGHFIS